MNKTLTIGSTRDLTLAHEGEGGGGLPRPSADDTPLPFTSTTLLQGFSALVRKLGGDPVRLAQDCGIDHRVFCDPAGWVCQNRAAKLLELAAVRLGCPDFGLRLAASQSMLAVLRPLDSLFSTAPTLRDAYRACSRHMCAYNTGVIMDLDEDVTRDHTLVHLHFIDSLGVFPQLTEMLLRLAHDTSSFLSRGSVKAGEVHFSHLPASSPVLYSRHFNTIVRFDQQVDGIVFSNRDMATRISDYGADRFASEAERFAKRYPSRLAGTKIHTRLAVFRLLSRHEECTRRNVARLLGIQERTLNRRLAREGTSFEQIRDLVRRSLAYRYLSREDLSLAEITGKLGYSELAVLSRSCHRWFGAPPQRLRRNLNWSRPTNSQSRETQSLVN